jgi:hypothetical protein
LENSPTGARIHYELISTGINHWFKSFTRLHIVAVRPPLLSLPFANLAQCTIVFVTLLRKLADLTSFTMSGFTEDVLSRAAVRAKAFARSATSLAGAELIVGAFRACLARGGADVTLVVFIRAAAASRGAISRLVFSGVAVVTLSGTRCTVLPWSADLARER